MSRYKFHVAYEGSSFSGWQLQKGAPTIQGALEQAFAELTGADVRIHGSGRTDAGVHAEGQVFHADLPESFPIIPENWPRALNTRLPHTIRVTQCTPVSDDFHARFSATGKSYRYRLVTDRILMPFDFQRAGHLPSPLDPGLFEQMIARFQGTHDFRSFAAVRGNEPDPLPEGYFVRTISHAKAAPTANGYQIDFTGTGFLYKMVRLMIGTAHAVATGKLSQESFEQLLTPHPTQNGKSRFCAPPHGLYLATVHYN